MNQCIAALLLLLTLLPISLARVDLSFENNNYYGYTFKQYVKDFNKTYKNDSNMNFHKGVFYENLKIVQQHNDKIINKTKDSYLKGINQYSDFTEKQFADAILKNSDIPPRITDVQTSLDKSIVVPKQINWVRAGKVTSIKNQNPCGGCYAFSSIAAVESAYLIAYNWYLNLSEQQILECTSDNNGCWGGNAFAVYHYIKDFGVARDDHYRPFNEGITQDCNKTVAGEFKISSYGFVKRGDCEELARALTLGPVSVQIAFGSLMDYKSGIVKECPGPINHGVLLVGMTDQYWLIKNSFGEIYGEDGFLRIARGNTCQICQYGTYPIIKK